MPWFFGEAPTWVRRNYVNRWNSNDPGTYVAGAQETYSIAATSRFDLRYGFTVVNGSGPRATGEGEVERRFSDDGGTTWTAWENWPGLGSKNMISGYSQFPVVFPPRYYEKLDVLLSPEWAGKRIEWRVAITSLFADGFGGETEQTFYGVPVEWDVLPVESSLLEEFDPVQSLAYLDGNVRKIRCIHRSPFSETLGIEGTRPEILVDSKDVEEFSIVHGTRVQFSSVPTVAYLVAGVRYDSPNLTVLRLTETEVET